MKEIKSFMEDRLKLPLCCYNSTIDKQIYLVAKAIVDSRKQDTSIFCTEIASELNMSPEHVELIQYILANVAYERENPRNPNSSMWVDIYAQPFTYGTSPRGLFVDDEEYAEKFLCEFRDYYLAQWEENIEEDSNEGN